MAKAPLDPGNVLLVRTWRKLYCVFVMDGAGSLTVVCMNPQDSKTPEAAVKGVPNLTTGAQVPVSGVHLFGDYAFHQRKLVSPRLTRQEALGLPRLPPHGCKPGQLSELTPRPSRGSEQRTLTPWAGRGCRGLGLVLRKHRTESSGPARARV